MKRISQRIKLSLLTAVVAISSVLGVFVTTSSVSAATATLQNIKDRYIIQGIKECYTGKNKGSYIMVSGKVAPSDITGWDKIVPNDRDAVGFYPGSQYLYQNCTGFLQYLGAPKSLDGMTDKDKEALLKKLGFNRSKNKQQCAIYDFSYGSKNYENVHFDQEIKFCAEVNSAGAITELNAPSLFNNRENPNEGYESNDYQVGFEYDKNQSQVSLYFGKMPAYGGTEAAAKPGLISVQKFVKGQTKFNDLAKKVENDILTRKDSLEGSNIGYSSVKITNSGNSNMYTLDRDGSKASYKAAYRKLTGKKYPHNGAATTTTEKAAAYQDILVTYYGIQKKGCAAKKKDAKSDGVIVATSDDDEEKWRLTKLFKKNGEAQYCYVKPSANAGKDVYAFTSSKISVPAMVKNGRTKFAGLTKWLISDESPKSIPAKLAAQIGKVPSSSGGSSGSGTKEKSCSDGAGSLGWVICPVLDAIGEGAQTAYNDYIEPGLTINPEMFTITGNDNDGIYGSWQIFQNFANIIFVIMILVVVFSQVTGVGINNYGIKRILPRMIIAAILINLSFIICQIAVDVSNIIGISMKNLFQSIGPDVGGIGATNGTGHFASTFIVILGALIGAGAILSGGIGIIIPILLAALSALISVFFLFLTLSARQAAVVILTVISPVAFVLYMFPNTQKYFRKLVGIFVAMLVLFPICGLVIGGGDFASRVVLAAGGVSVDNSQPGNGVFFQLSAMLIGVVPIFFIPTLLKNSLSGLGNIGAKISGVGKSVGSRANRAAGRGLENSRLGAAAKNYREGRENRINYQRNQAHQRRLAGVDREGNLTRSGRRRRRIANGEGLLGRLASDSRREHMQMTMGNAQSDILRSEQSLRNAERMLDGTHIEAVRAGMEASDMDQAVKDQEALLAREPDGDGLLIDNIGSGDQMLSTGLGAAYRAALSDLNTAAPDDVDARARVFAIQNKLASTNAGRDVIQAALADAQSHGQTTGLTRAASHLMNNHGGTIKGANRGLFNWANRAAAGNIESMNDHYGDGARSYTATTLAAADSGALEHLVNSLGTMSGEDRAAIAGTAREALGNENIRKDLKPEVETQLRALANYQGSPIPPPDGGNPPGPSGGGNGPLDQIPLNPTRGGSIPGSFTTDRLGGSSTPAPSGGAGGNASPSTASSNGHTRRYSSPRISDSTFHINHNN